MEADDIELGSDDTDSEDEEYVPKENRPRLKKTLKKKKKKKRKLPNLDELSLPKPPARLDANLDLGDAALAGCAVDDKVEPQMSPILFSGVRCDLLVARPPTRSTPSEQNVAEYRTIYGLQLPGMPFYYDACQALLTLDDGPAPGPVSGGATFRLLTLECAGGGALLILDVLALAVNPDSSRRGVGSRIVDSLKAIARREASARGMHPLLLTQADLSCVGFWAKNDFARARDANALVRSLRRSSGLTIFTGATPMALLLPPEAATGRGAAKGHKMSKQKLVR